MAEVVVVGASVAGATTAIHLARLGHSIQLLDRAQSPRRKACGEGLFPAGVAELDALGLLSNLRDDACVVDSIRFEILGRTVEAPLGTLSRPAIGVQRMLLDDALLAAARKAGVDVFLGLRATGLARDANGFSAVMTDHGEIAARVIVAADGLGSRLRHAAELDRPTRRRRYGVSAHFRLPAHAAPRVDVHFRTGHEVYVTPVGGEIVNVAVLLGREKARELGGGLAASFDRIVRGAVVLPPNAVRIDEPLAAGPFPAAAMQAWRDNLVLAGDAAGFFDGITGEGISIGLVAARSCAAAVHRFLAGEGEAAFASYDRQRRSLCRNSTLLGGLTLFLAAHPRLGAWATGNLARRPETFARLVAISQGEQGFRCLRPRDLRALVGV